MNLLWLTTLFIASSKVFATDACSISLPSPVPALGGCGNKLPHGQELGATTNVSIISGGLERSYLVFIPPLYNEWALTPVIFSYHGGTKTAEDQLELDLFTSTTFNNNSIVIYPQGVNVRENITFWISGENTDIY
jgi:poly(3-hydroxybutyrate) depolymerase